MAAGDFEAALAMFQRAYDLHKTDKLLNKINKLKVFLSLSLSHSLTLKKTQKKTTHTNTQHK